LQRYSFETVALVKDRLQVWEQQSYEQECGPDVQPPATPAGEECKGVDFHFVEVSFSAHPDEEEQDYLKQLPTSFVLTDEAVDRLIAAGRLVLRSSEEYQRLLAGAKSRQ
jgi:NTE family protein